MISRSGSPRICRRPGAVALLVFFALSSACTTLGPDFEEPDPIWLAEWQPDLYGQLATDAGVDALDLGRWWLRFDDADLTSLIERMLSNNRNLQVAGLRVLEARARLGGAEALRYPQVQQLEAGAAVLRQSQSDGLLPASDSSLRSYNAGVSLGWELDFWGRFERSIQAADAAFLTSIAAQRDLQVLLIAQTVELYYAYRTTQLRIAIAEENATIQERSYQITRQLYDSGQESELDLQQALTQYLATRATIPDLQRSLIQQRNGIALLLGQTPGSVAELSGGGQALPTLEPIALKDIPAQLLLRRPDVRASAWGAAAQSAQIGIANAELYPSISIFGSFGWTGDSLDATRDGTTFAAGPAISWNIFDYGRIRANVLVQDARLQQALQGFEETILQAAREIDDAAIAVVKTAESRAVLTQSREAAQRSLAIANSRYREGYADFQRVLDAQRALFSQAEKELLNEGAHIAAVIDLYKSLGGGWQSMPAESLVPAPIREQMRERSDWEALLEGPLPENLDQASSAGSSP